MANKSRTMDSKDKSSSTYKPGANKAKGKNKYGGKKSNKPEGFSNASSDKLSSLNDLSWYNRFPELLEAAGRIPFPKVPGMQYLPNSVVVVDNEAGTAQPKQGLTECNYIPSFFAIDWAPSVGKSNDNTSAISIVGREMYAKVRSKFSGSLDENGPDIVMYLMALDSVFSALGYMKRLYRCLNTVSPFNKDLPYGILTALEYDPAEVNTMFQKKTEIWGQINDLINKVSKFTCPDVMDVFKRHYWMSSNIYGDANSPKAQFYVFNQKLWHTYTPSTSTGGSLTATQPTARTWNALYKMVWDMISALSGSDDIYTINGHMMRAFEGVPSFKVDLLQENEILDTVYVPEVLSQIHNARVGMNAFQAGAFDITQDPTTNAVIHNPALYVPTSVKARKFFFMPGTDMLMDMHSDVPTVSEITIASRLAPVVVEYDESKKEAMLNGGTEIPLGFTVVVAQGDGTYKSTTLPQIINMDSVADAAECISLASHFDWCPILYVSYETTEGEVKVLSIAETYNPTAVSSTAMVDLHKVCVLSEFNAYGI